jgi:hypothetical protein
MEIALFNKHGKPVAYIAEDGETVYLWDGRPVAYLSDDKVYGWNGRQVGVVSERHDLRHLRFAERLH